MELSIRPAAKLSAAAKLVDDIFYKRDVYYLFFGKLEPWGVIDYPEVQALASEKDERIVRGSTIFYKRLGPSDVSLATKRIEWESGTVYAEWDDTLDMSTLDFFVLADGYRIYKCLDNNLGAPSTSSPTGTPFNTFQTADGYVWKYMYTIPPAKRTRFLSNDKVPVQRAFTDSFYNNGSIERVVIASGGAGYTMTPITTMSVSGSTVGTGAVLSIATVNGSGGITGITITDGGTGYVGSCTLTISGAGTGAVLTPTFTAGVITAVTITAPGTGYVGGSSIVVSVGGAHLIPVVSNGSIESVTIENPGSGYSGVPTISIATTGTVDGKYPGNSTALFTALMLDGRIDRVAIMDPGTGYQESYNTTITPVGDGFGASLIPVVDGGEIVDVFVEDPGYGYSSVALNVTTNPAASTEATLTAVISEYDLSTDQSIVEQAAVDGAIHLIKATIQGEGYSNLTTTVSIVGDGTGATCLPVIVDGAIIKYTITNAGSGYTYANVVITDEDRDIADAANLLIDASARAIIPPAGGHGKNAPVELLADSAMITSSLRGIPALSEINQQFRQYGLLRNLRTELTNARVDVLQSYEVYEAEFNLASIIGLQVDDVIHNAAQEEYRVVYIDNDIVHLAPNGRNASSPLGTLYPSSGGGSYTCEAIISAPLINKYSGDVYFISNEAPFVIDDANGIFIRTHISF